MTLKEEFLKTKTWEESKDEKFSGLKLSDAEVFKHLVKLAEKEGVDTKPRKKGLYTDCFPERKGGN